MVELRVLADILTHKCFRTRLVLGSITRGYHVSPPLLSGQEISYYMTSAGKPGHVTPPSGATSRIQLKLRNLPKCMEVLDQLLLAAMSLLTSKTPIQQSYPIPSLSPAASPFRYCENWKRSCSLLVISCFYLKLLLTSISKVREIEVRHLAPSLKSLLSSNVPRHSSAYPHPLSCHKSEALRS